jgi:hypothetical protein
MSVYDCTDDFSQRRVRRKDRSVFFPQRRQYAFKVQFASRPPRPKSADRTAFATNLSGVPSNDSFNSVSAMPFIRYHDVRQFMVDHPASPAPQSAYDQRFLLPGKVNEVSFSAADYYESSGAYRAGGDSFAIYVKFPSLSRSARYRLIITICFHRPSMGIISGYSWTGKLGGCGAFWDGGNTVSKPFFVLSAHSASPILLAYFAGVSFPVMNLPTASGPASYICMSRRAIVQSCATPVIHIRRTV